MVTSVRRPKEWRRVPTCSKADWIWPLRCSRVDWWTIIITIPSIITHRYASCDYIDQQYLWLSICPSVITDFHDNCKIQKVWAGELWYLRQQHNGGGNWCLSPVSPSLKGPGSRILVEAFWLGFWAPRYHLTWPPSYTSLPQLQAFPYRVAYTYY